MKYCKKCVMPDTRPGIQFDSEGVCSACRHHEEKAKVDWDKRWKELEDLADRYRRKDGYYDCIVTVSGGKDSHYQLYIFKEKLKMNPLLVNVFNFSWTDIGWMNYNNMSDVFGADTISLHLNRKLARKFLWKALVKMGSPTWYWDRAVYAFPLRMGINFKIPLIIYGENVPYEYGGFQTEETYSAMNQISNDVVKEVAWDYWLDDDIQMKDLNTCIYPTKEEIASAKLEPIYLSYFVNWEGHKNMELMKKYGFKSLDDTKEWKRAGYIEDYDQIDTKGYLVHPWLKYPKFGHARATDVGSIWVRNGRITREEAVKLVKENDYKLDPEALKDFLDFVGHTEEEFWKAVEPFWNKDLFEKVNGKWILKDPIWKQK
ncbi:MAG: N-acetyl sugar amidotransferase [bacterium]|nr:N-acetyl sugar amidotransferase [bacterium]